MVDNNGTAATGSDADAELQLTKNRFVTAATAHLLSEKKIALGLYPGVEFEAESNVGHFSARFYLVGTTLYKTAVVTPLGKSYADTSFLDSFQLIPRVAN